MLVQLLPGITKSLNLYFKLFTEEVVAFRAPTFQRPYADPNQSQILMALEEGKIEPLKE
jgi:hypothetical protein